MDKKKKRLTGGDPVHSEGLIAGDMQALDGAQTNTMIKQKPSY